MHGNNASASDKAMKIGLLRSWPASCWSPYPLMVVGLKNLPHGQRRQHIERVQTYSGAAEAARALSDNVSGIRAWLVATHTSHTRGCSAPSCDSIIWYSERLSVVGSELRVLCKLPRSFLRSPVPL